MSERGKYIVIEGHDGTGKSGQQELLAARLSQNGLQTMDFIEPGETPIGAELRLTIKNGNLERDGVTNVLLFTADRRELWNQKIEPALKAGMWVVSARSWYSTLAYQGYGEGVNTDLIEETTRKYVGEQYTSPDLAIVLALSDEEERLRRVEASADTASDTFEQKDAEFQKRVNEAYLKVARQVGAHALEFTAADDKKQVHERIWSLTQTLFD